MWIRHSPLLSQYQSYWYPTVHLCPSTRPVVLILYSPLLPQYQTYRYNTFHYCPITSLSDTLQSTIIEFPVLLMWLLSQYQSVWCAQSTNALVPVLLILHSPLLSQYQITIDTSALVRATDTLQTTTAGVPVLLIWLSPLVHKYQSYWYHKSTPVQVPVLLIPYSAQLQSTTAPVPVLLIWHSTLLSQYHICYSTLLPSISHINTTRYTTVPLPVLLILHSPLLSKYH